MYRNASNERKRCSYYRKPTKLFPMGDPCGSNNTKWPLLWIKVTFYLNETFDFYFYY